MNTVLIEKFKNQTGLNVFAIDETGYYNAPVYAEFLEEEIASRDSRQLSAVPSESIDNLLRDLVDEVQRWDDAIDDIKYRIDNNCHLHRVLRVAKEYLKQRGIAG